MKRGGVHQQVADLLKSPGVFGDTAVDRRP